MHSLLTEYKGHLSIVLAKFIAALVLLDALNLVEKGLAIIISLIMAFWGIKHLQGRIELNMSLKKEADTRRQMMDQEIYLKIQSAKEREKGDGKQEKDRGEEERKA